MQVVLKAAAAMLALAYRCGNTKLSSMVCTHCLHTAHSVATHLPAMAVLSTPRVQLRRLRLLLPALSQRRSGEPQVVSFQQPPSGSHPGNTTPGTWLPDGTPSTVHRSS